MVTHCLAWQHSVLRLQKYAKKPEVPNFRQNYFSRNGELNYHPVFGYAGVGIELHADLHHLPALRLIGEGIAFLVNLLQRLQCVKRRDVGLEVLHLANEESGRATLKPVVGHLPLLKGLQQAERVIDFRRIFRKVIAVVSIFQFLGQSCQHKYTPHA